MLLQPQQLDTSSVGETSLAATEARNSPARRATPLPTTPLRIMPP